MENSEVIGIIKRRFDKKGNPTQIPLLKGGKSFKAELSTDGIYVDNLGNQPFLPWVVFTETVSLLKRSGGRAVRGNAMMPKLGEQNLPITSVEGHIAHVIYGKQMGDSVFRRVTPIACILIWAKICRHEPSELVLSGIA
jgi:hypothetical protein